jgi:hypothetical protein
VLPIEVKARAARHHQAANSSRHSAPRAADIGQILGGRTGWPVLIDERIHDVVDWLEHPMAHCDVPVAVRQDIVAGTGLRLGGRGQLS